MSDASTRAAWRGWLDREHTVAKPGYNRWLAPPCALAIHLCIGMAYGFSVFWLPLARAVGVNKPVVCKAMTLGQALTTTACDWRVSDLTWIYSLFFVSLGAAAAVWGGWLETAGPRKAAVVAAFYWAGGIAVAAVGVAVHRLWIMWLGAGVIGGVGLGLGYIAPVSTLIKWFPDKRGMATGMAIMGFGGGALIGSPLADNLMKHFAGPHGVGVWQTFLALAIVYFAVMLVGALGFRVPPAGWSPPDAKFAPLTPASSATFNVHVRDVHRTPQFWLIWAVLLLNVTASIGIIGIASPMIQEIFAGRLFHHPDVGFLQFDDAQKKAAAAAGAGFVGFLSLFNIAGRFFWSSTSDLLGRKTTYAVMLAAGAVLFAITATWSAAAGLLLVFALTFAVITSMYGGGFATVPAYLADIFGTQFVGAIHGRLLTAWSTAGVLGPLIVTGMREHALAAGTARRDLYPPIFLVLAALLAVGFVANLFVRPVEARFHSAETHVASKAMTDTGPSRRDHGIGLGGFDAPAAIAWALVGLPLLWGVWVTLAKASALFH